MTPARVYLAANPTGARCNQRLHFDVLELLRGLPHGVHGRSGSPGDLLLDGFFCLCLCLLRSRVLGQLFREGDEVGLATRRRFGKYMLLTTRSRLSMGDGNGETWEES